MSSEVYSLLQDLEFHLRNFESNSEILGDKFARNIIAHIAADIVDVYAEE